ncbi:MAG: ATP-dependent DNA helicase [Deltaproteobacteria bacterium]|nr:ATP-dependent DNA helicase [Deltaproteobacteria bacterium]
MAEAVERVLEHEGVLLVEAGTGTGKTLAYLVPAVLSGRKVIVSTGTRALQDQIVERDLPLLAELTGLGIRAASMKGLSNYVCRRRLAESVAAGGYGDPHLEVVRRWVETAERGDRAELAVVPENAPVWMDVTSSSETRIGQRCEHYEACFVTRMREDAEAAQIVVVNHHLFFADLALRASGGGSVLPEHDAVVFDEAHGIEEVATTFFGLRVSSTQIVSLVRDARRTLASAGLLDRAGRGEADGMLAEVEQRASIFFGALPVERGDAELRIPLDASLFDGPIGRDLIALDTALDALASYARGVAAVGEPVLALARRTDSLRDDLDRVVHGVGNTHVAWCQASRRSVALGASPIDLSELLREHLFYRERGVVLASATLTTDGDFSFIRRRLGLDFPCEELAVSSPFDFGRQAALYLPRDLPDPRDALYRDRAAREIERLVRLTRGGAFVLCTSVKAMRQLAEAGRMAFEWPVLVQGDAPKAALLSRFRRAHDAVLYATASFWEGVDVPGDALRLVVIDRLPFEVPTDPVVAARSRRMRDDGVDPFDVYQVPAAALALKQGFGRLVRTRRDHGIVAVLDRRIVTRGYGRRFVETLPPASRCLSFAEVEAFWREAADGRQPAAAPPEDLR